MKAQRAHRRKLRFSSTKAVAPKAAVKVEQASQRPIKRRKRHQRVKSVSDWSASPVDSLPASIANGIQERFATAKSLGEITLTVLQLFKEHEGLQRSVSGPVFPILVPTSEIYKMKVPRKRRIYDVLHVLEGIGVIKRARYNEARNAKGAYFRYYGKAAVVQHLECMKANATQAVMSFRQSHRSMRSSIVDEDKALVKTFEDQATIENWPCLVTMTVCFLGLMFQQDHVGVELSTISDRLIEAKKASAVAPSSTTVAAYSDVQRRVYDVVSVLGSCNMIDTSLVHSPKCVDKCLRKHVCFNYDIFTNPRLLFAIPAPATNRNDSTNSVPLFDDIVISLRGLNSPQSGSSEYQLISPPLAYWQNLHAASALMASPTFPPAATPMPSAKIRDATNWEQLTSEETQGTAVKCQPSLLLTPKNFVRCPPQAQTSPRIHKFFSPFGALTAKNEWYDESLKHLGLYEALPAEDKIDWELNKLFKESYREMWGYQYPTTAPSKAPDHQILVGRADAKVTDLECHELLGDNMPEDTANFFC